MNSDIASLHKVLKDETRRKIILLLQEKGSLSYVDLMKTLGITNTGKMNYHLKVLGNLLAKKEDGQYALTEKGTLASRLLLEYRETEEKQTSLDAGKTQVFWGGIIICGFAIIDLLVLLQYVLVAFASGWTSQLGSIVPFLFLGVVFLLIGFYMIISDVKKDAKISRKLSGLTKKRATISIVFLIIMGTALLGLASAHLQTNPRLTQVGYEDENLGAWKTYTIFLEQGYYRFDIVVDVAEIGKSYNISVVDVEKTQILFGIEGPVEGLTISQTFPVTNQGDYRIEWHDLNVTQITIYRVDEFSRDLIPRQPLTVSGVFSLIAGIGSVVMLELFQNEREKTGFFWWGLIVSGFALSWLFGLFWWMFALDTGFYGAILPFFGSWSSVVELIGGFVLLYVGFYMVRRQAKNEGEMKKFKFRFDLSQRNHRAVAYLLVSIIANAWLVAVGNGVYWSFLFYVNFLGVLFAMLIFGRPLMYGGWFNPLSILPFVLFVFTLFVEIFVVAEIFISISKWKIRKKTNAKT